MCVLYPAYVKRSARVTSSRGSPHAMKFDNSSNCIPVRNESRPDISDAFVLFKRQQEEREGHIE